MTPKCLNHFMIIWNYKNLVDKLDMNKISNDLLLDVQAMNVLFEKFE